MDTPSPELVCEIEVLPIIQYKRKHSYKYRKYIHNWVFPAFVRMWGELGSLVAVITLVPTWEWKTCKSLQISFQIISPSSIPGNVCLGAGLDGQCPKASFPPGGSSIPAGPAFRSLSPECDQEFFPPLYITIKYWVLKEAKFFFVCVCVCSS